MFRSLLSGFYLENFRAELAWKARRSTLVFLLSVAPAFAIVSCGGTTSNVESPAQSASNISTDVPISDDVPNIVTADIQAGIEKFIDERTREGNGYFRFTADGKEYAFRLVRVHTEYLSNLGPGRHFACVDLVDTEGDVYDVDFFLEGDPGSMDVTDMTVHKLNGKPYYAWKRMPDRTWARVPPDTDTQRLTEIIEGKDAFEFRYSFTIPSMESRARVWLPVPVSDSFQKVTLTSLDAPADYEEITDREYGNRILYLELDPSSGGRTIDIRYQVERLEKSAYGAHAKDVQGFLNPEALVPANEEFRLIAEEVVKDKKGDLVKARALYDHVIDRMKYMKYGSGWGRGDAVYACDARTGNCTDFHAYFIALSRSVGIPARFAIGAAIPASRDEGGIDGYHCWVEFHAEGKWWPVDISEGDKYAPLATYFFGHHPANRIELSRGRDLAVDPAPASGPINFLAYPLLEVNGSPVKVVPQFSFTRS